MYIGKCLTPVTHPESGDLLEEGVEIKISDKAQFDSLVGISAIVPDEPAQKSAAKSGKSEPATPAA